MTRNDILLRQLIWCRGGVVLSFEAGQWHNLKCLESGTILLEAKDGAYRPLGEEEIMVK